MKKFAFSWESEHPKALDLAVGEPLGIKKEGV